MIMSFLYWQEGYWGLQLGGCRRCECGAGVAACDPRTGACACAPGVGGPHCDVCLPGYYGFGIAGCLRKLNTLEYNRLRFFERIIFFKSFFCMTELLLHFVTLITLIDYGFYANHLRSKPP